MNKIVISHTQPFVEVKEVHRETMAARMLKCVAFFDCCKTPI